MSSVLRLDGTCVSELDLGVSLRSDINSNERNLLNVSSFTAKHRGMIKYCTKVSDVRRSVTTKNPR